MSGDTIAFRVNPAERTELAARAAREKLNLSDYIRIRLGLPGHWSRHNQSYWRGVPYAGLGPGAHEYDGAGRLIQPRPGQLAADGGSRRGRRLRVPTTASGWWT